MKNTILILIISLFLLTPVFAQQSNYTIKNALDLQRITSPTISPNGKKILFTLFSRDLKENKIKNALWTVDVSTGELRQLTEANIVAFGGRWSPDGKYISYTAVVDGEAQIWLMKSSGANPKKITSLANGATGAVWSPNSDKVIFISSVYKNCKTEAENKKKKEELGKSRIRAKIINEIPYQDVAKWIDDKESHLFIMSLTDLKPYDLTPDVYDISSYNFSPDGKEICFTTNKDKNRAWNYNSDLFTINLDKKTTKKITENPATDFGSLYSPSGKYIAYTAMERADFGLDKLVLCLYNRKDGSITELTKSLDRAVNEYIWAPDENSLIFSSFDEGYSSIYEVTIKDKSIKQLTKKSYNDSLTISPDGKTIYLKRQSINLPPELFSMTMDGNTKKLTDINSYLSKISLNSAEELIFKASDGEFVHGFIVKPPRFDPNKKYPLVCLVHGGPQGAWRNAFAPELDMQLFAAQGYIVAAINIRGSLGYGQKFTDDILGNWGGRPYDDLMEGIDYILENHKYVDGNKMAIAGASYGGYMTNWVMGHTDRFKCAISISGVFNIISLYGAVDSPYIFEWELNANPYIDREAFEKWNPINYASNFKTPCLVVHGEIDYRTPISEGKQLFTALQRNNIPSRFLYFPDESHSIMGTKNTEIWYNTMNSWLKEWLK